MKAEDLRTKTSAPNTKSCPCTVPKLSYSHGSCCIGRKNFQIHPVEPTAPRSSHHSSHRTVQFLIWQSGGSLKLNVLLWHKISQSRNHFVTYHVFYGVARLLKFIYAHIYMGIEKPCKPEGEINGPEVKVEPTIVLCTFQKFTRHTQSMFTTGVNTFCCLQNSCIGQIGFWLAKMLLPPWTCF